MCMYDDLCINYSYTNLLFVFFEGYGDHRDLHVLTHSFPTRRSSDLAPISEAETPPPLIRKISFSSAIGAMASVGGEKDVWTARTLWMLSSRFIAATAACALPLL